MADVTAITYAINNSTDVVHLIDYENPDHTGNNATLNSGARLGPPTVNMWIPWCTSQNDFASGKYIEATIAGSGDVYYIWQQGTFVRYMDKKEWRDDGPKIPGNPDVGGNRSLKIAANGSISLARNSP